MKAKEGPDKFRHKNGPDKLGEGVLIFPTDVCIVIKGICLFICKQGPTPGGFPLFSLLPLLIHFFVE